MQKEEEYQRAYVERILGVTWDYEIIKDILKPKKGSSGKFGPGSTFHIPLALMLRPDSIKEFEVMLKANRTTGISESIPADAISLMDESKEKFLEMMRGAHIGTGIPMPKSAGEQQLIRRRDK